MRAFVFVTLCTIIGVVKGNCPNACSEHGECGKKAKCECHGEWMGADCSLRICSFGKAFIDSPEGDLNGDGVLSPSRAFSPLSNWKFVDKNNVVGGNSELSYTDYGYARANTTIPWNEAHFYRECSNKGICDREIGQCKCFPGYTGGACERIACPKDCSGHGRCLTIRDSVGDSAYSAWDIDSTQMCKCDPGFYGPDCSLRVCPRGADPVKYSNTVDNSLHGIYWRTFAGDKTQTQTEAGKMKFLKDKPKRVYYTITYSDEYGDTWTTKLLSIDYTSFCTDKGYCFSTPQISGDAEAGGKKGKAAILQTNLRNHNDNLNASFNGLPTSSAPGHYVWSTSSLMNAYCGDDNVRTVAGGAGTTSAVQNQLDHAKIKTCTKEVQIRSGASEKFLVHPSKDSPLNSALETVFVDGLDFRLDLEAAHHCLYFEKPIDKNELQGVWRNTVNKIKFDSTTTSAFGVCDFVLLKDHGVASPLKVSYFYQPESQINGISAAPNKDPPSPSTGSTVKFEAIKGQTVGSLTSDEITRNTDVVVVQSLNDQRVWNKLDGDVSKKFISQASDSLDECSKRGICNTATGVCNCFAGYNGLRCETRHAIAYTY